MLVRGTFKCKRIGCYELVVATGEGSHYHESRFTILLISKFERHLAHMEGIIRLMLIAVKIGGVLGPWPRMLRWLEF